MEHSRQPILGILQAAKLLALEDEDIVWLINSGQLPARNINNKTLIAIDDIQRLIDAYAAVARRRTHS